jgi:uncharacterized membrane protein (GlpM family)
MTRLLHLAASPTFAIMALVTAAQDRGMPLCSTSDVFGLGGMMPMYLLMAVFHSAPWLKMIARRENVTLLGGLDRSGDVQTMEQKP